MTDSSSKFPYLLFYNTSISLFYLNCKQNQSIDWFFRWVYAFLSIFIDNGFHQVFQVVTDTEPARFNTKTVVGVGCVFSWRQIWFLQALVLKASLCNLTMERLEYQGCAFRFWSLNWVTVFSHPRAYQLQLWCWNVHCQLQPLVLVNSLCLSRLSALARLDWFWMAMVFMNWANICSGRARASGPPLMAVLEVLYTNHNDLPYWAWFLYVSPRYRGSLHKEGHPRPYEPLART